MILTLPTAWFPPVAYMAACLDADEIRIEAEETYSRQTCRNRCAIRGPNGRQVLSIPVHKVSGNHTKTREVRIAFREPWQRNHWRSIEAAYNQSPFFLYYRDDLEGFFREEIPLLIDLNTRILETLFRLLRIEKKITLTESFDGESAAGPSSILVSKHHHPPLPAYTQVFGQPGDFLPNLSILDCLFNLGPDTTGYLQKTHQTLTPVLPL